MRTSSYVIYVDLPSDPEHMLLVQGYTGAHDIVNRSVATFLRSCETRKPPKPLYGVWTSEPNPDGDSSPPSDSALGTLAKRGYLTALSEDDEETLFKKVAAKLHQAHSRSPQYIVMPTYNCNLRCSYCFQDHMRTNPLYSHLLRPMAPNTVERMIKGVWNIEGLYGIDPDTFSRNVGLFGGEPLLKSNRATIEHILEVFRRRGSATFWAITNGTEIDAYLDLLGPDQIASLQITLDGPPEQHDIRRIYADGSGSFQVIAQNINRALDAGVQVSIRLNLDRNNIEHLPRLAELISNFGWDKRPKFGVFTAPVRAVNEKTEKKTTFDSWELDRALVKLHLDYDSSKMFTRPDNPIKQQARALFDGPGTGLPRMKDSFCGAHTSMFIFDAFCDIYTCWERTGDINIRAGHIADNGDLQLDESTLNIWRSRTVTSNPICSKCRYALHCGGGCAILAEQKSGTMHKNFCDGFSNRFRAAVAEAYEEHLAKSPVAAGAVRFCDQ